MSSFLHVYAVCLEEEYGITYVMENELNLDKNKLHICAHDLVADYYWVVMSKKDTFEQQRASCQFMVLVL